MYLNPLVSICIPTYNGEKYLKEALDSALNQTYANIEIIVSDDGSTDTTIDIITEYVKDSSIPVKLYNHQSKGIGANWNNCVRKSNGEYIKFLFQDDVLHPRCIDEMVKMAKLNEQIGLVYCKRAIIYSKNNINHNDWVAKYGSLHNKWNELNPMDEPIIDGKCYLKDYNLLKEPLNKIGEPTATLIAKKCFEEVGFFSDSMKQALDIEYWFRLMKAYKICFINKKLISFRLHNQQASFINKENDFSEVAMLLSTMYRNYFWLLNPKIRFNKVLKTLTTRLSLKIKE